MRNTIRVVVLIFVCALVAFGQSFSSGSTGADGALDLTSGDRTVRLPDSGILNYTTVNIPEGRTLTFSLNLRNTPVVMLAQGAVTISGTINITGSGQTPGPGGFYGGAALQDGFGPGGGLIAGSRNGSWVGPLSLVPIAGGSGSASPGIYGYYCVGSLGAGGGGAIVIASSVSLTLAAPSYINALPASAGCISNQTSYQGGSGAIRLVSNSLTVNGRLDAAMVRLEAPLNALTYNGNGTPPVRSTINPILVPTNAPLLNILSVGGYPVPSYSGYSFTTIDVMLPNQLADPIPIVIQGTNVPVGSPVRITFGGSLGATSTTATLTGTSASSTATLYISGLTRSSVTLIFALATFDPLLLAGNSVERSPDGVSWVELATSIGEKTTYRFFRADGTELDSTSLQEPLQRAFELKGQQQGGNTDADERRRQSRN